MRIRTAGIGPLELLRFMVGTVFLSEGIQKFLFPADLGAGRFARIGIPWPQVMGPFVGVVEIIGGVLLILNVQALYAAIALLIDISVAILSTKIPILLGRALGPFSLPKLPSYGLWSFLHEARTDWCMFLGGLAIILACIRPHAATSRREVS
jgi:putative oxidoreductase